MTMCTLPIAAPGREEKFEGGRRFRSPRLGIQVVRDHLIRQGYPKEKIKFYDVELLVPSDNELRQYLQTVRPDVVGLSAVLSHSYLQAKRLAAIVREELPDTWIVLGGNLSASANVVLRRTDIDCCVVGDGEETFFKLLEYVKTWGREKRFDLLKEIRGLSFLDDNGELIFEGYPNRVKNEVIPLPDYEFYKSGLLDHPEFLEGYFKPIQKWERQFSLDARTKESHRKPVVAEFFTTKGCTARCTFCQRNTRGYRLAELGDIEAHLKLLTEKYDVGFISCMDENFGSRREHARAFADLMEKYGLLWTATGVRCVNVTREDVEYFVAKGCCSLQFGVESGSQAMLDSMEKNFTKKDVEKALEACWDNGIYSPLSLMVGMPGEDKQTIRESGEFVGKMAYRLGVHPRDFGVSVFYALPFPGTPLYDYCVQVGLIDSSVDGEEQYLVKLANGKTNKWDYLNVNGAPVSEVLAWDLWLNWQASKTYKQLSKKYPKAQSELARKWETTHVNKGSIAHKSKLSRNRRISLYLMISQFSRFYESAFILNLPAWAAFPLIRVSFYVGTLLYHWIGKLIGRPTFAIYKDRITPKKYTRPDSQEKRLARSLRAVVNMNRVDIDNPTRKAREKLLRGAAN